MLSLTKISSLSRVRAKLQNEYKLFQASDLVKKYRGVLEEEKKREAIEDKPDYPLYTVYIDESGKTEKYISVGSLWKIKPKSGLFAQMKLSEWKSNRKIEYEFHFSKVTPHKLETYKAFFLEFLRLFTDVGFKVIFVERSGLKNISSTITDLTFHLINNGIIHEDESGRAPLPRMLQVIIDNEESGSDALKLENIKERIKSQDIEGLLIDRFTASDSKGNIYLQVVDLFISSINRKLNNSINQGKPKDELADYILALLDFDLSNINLSNSNADKSKIFNLHYK